ncbi:MAG: class I SAM-dependent rRNA methyltransferase [Deltaproteobacteria bacterium]|nr:class I SAM-dependent rRNA methyltransferase [Deltaproteobacteria bacterium]
MPQAPTVILRKKLERALAQGHPWLWRDALVPHDWPAGTTVEVHDRRGNFLARGITDGGALGVRIWTTDPREALDRRLFARRFDEALQLRRRVTPPRTGGIRLLHGEGDRTPGVVCDVYGEVAVVKLDGDGIARWHADVLEALRGPLGALGVETLLLRNGRREEAQCDVVWGTQPEGPLTFEERGMTLWVDVVHGQKTGMFLDHRESRARVRELAADARVLNLFGYTGGFSIAAGLGGARHVDTVDLAGPALALAERGWESNGLDASGHRCHRADAFAFLEHAAARRERWDVIIADPPSFAPSEEALEAALASYRKLHAACLAVLAPGGLYLGASCSSHVRRDAFDESILAGAARARRSLQLLDSWGAAPDHPRLPAFPEGDYLKSTLVRAL